MTPPVKRIVNDADECEEQSWTGVRGFCFRSPFGGAVDKIARPLRLEE